MLLLLLLLLLVIPDCCAVAILALVAPQNQTATLSLGRKSLPGDEVGMGMPFALVFLVLSAGAATIRELVYWSSIGMVL